MKRIGRLKINGSEFRLLKGHVSRGAVRVHCIAACLCVRTKTNKNLLVFPLIFSTYARVLALLSYLSISTAFFLW